jgi:hypothetical protein
MVVLDSELYRRIIRHADVIQKQQRTSKQLLESLLQTNVVQMPLLLHLSIISTLPFGGLRAFPAG